MIVLFQKVTNTPKIQHSVDSSSGNFPGTKYALSIYKFKSCIFQKLCAIIFNYLCSICILLFFRDHLLCICGIFLVTQIFHFISNPFKLLFSFYFICLDNAILQNPYCIFSSVHFILCCFKIIFLPVIIFLLDFFGELYHSCFLSFHFTMSSLTSESLFLSSSVVFLVCLSSWSH